MFRRTICRLVLCLIVLIATGCGQESDDDGEPVTTTPGDTMDPSPYRGVVVINDALAPLDQWGSDEYEIRADGDHAPFIMNDTLTITVSYGGGCETHDVTLVAFPPDTLPESYPVPLDVSLAHDANRDSCLAYLTETYVFDLTPIKTWYQEAYPDDAGTIILLLEGAPDDSPELVYMFGTQTQGSTD